MQHQQENKQENFTCPITNNCLSKCGVKSCMWNSEKFQHNCAITDNTISEYDIGEVKNYSINSVNKLVRKGKADIIKILTLDKYLSYVKENSFNIKIRGKRYVKKIFKESTCSNVVFGLNYKVFAIACLENIYEEFRNANSELKQTKLSSLLNVRENKLKVIQNSIKVI
jgi:hypothetical protein